MAGKIKPIAAMPVGCPAFVQTSYTTATYYPIGISRDRATIYGAYGSTTTNLAESTDDGSTWTVLESFVDAVQGIIELDDGEAIVQTFGSPYAKLYKSSGWATSHSTATFSPVLTAIRGYNPLFSLHCWSFGDNDILSGSSAFGVTAGYGSFTTGTGDTDRSTKVYFTSNYGATWAQVFDLVTYRPGVATLSIMATAYDPIWDRLWLTYENGTPVGETGIMYSDDHGQNWRAVAGPSGWATSGGWTRFTTLAPIEDAIVLHNAHSGGVWRMARIGYRQLGPLQNVAWLKQTMIAEGAYQARGVKGAPLLLGAITDATSNEVAPYIMAFTGATLTDLWQDETLLNVMAVGPLGVFGPTKLGNLVAHVLAPTSAARRLLVGQYIPAGVDTASSVQASFAAQTAATDADTLITRAPADGLVSAVTLLPLAAVTGDTANKRTFTLVNKGQAGAGSTVVATLDLVTGTNLAAYDEARFTLSSTLASRQVVAGDVLELHELHAAVGLAHSGGVLTTTFV